MRWLLVLVWILAGQGLLRADEFESAGVRLHYTITGPRTGQPVVLVHGFLVNGALQWTIPGVTKSLAKEYRVIILDHRGHGRSGKPYRPEAYGTVMADDLARLLDHLQLPQAHIVGYSMGAFIGLKFATKHPERVKSLTLGGAGWMRPDGPVIGHLATIASDLEAGRGVGALLRALNPPGRGVDESRLATASKLALAINDVRAIAAVARAMPELAVTPEELSRVTMPVLCLVGADDPLKASVDVLLAERPHTLVQVLPNANHMTTYGRPEFVNALRDFLARASTPASRR